MNHTPSDGPKPIDVLLRSIPVVVLTTSDSDRGILKSYDLQASCYITKSVDFQQLTNVIHSIRDFWFHVVKLPRK